jgi:thiamine-phosphate pyrophosphorylase
LAGNQSSRRSIHPAEETMTDRSRPCAPRLIAITDTRIAPVGQLEQRLERVAASAIAQSVMIQLRDRELPVRERLALGRRLVAIAHRHGQLFAVNDRADLALLLGADGLHLGERSVEANDARELVGPERFISRACHDPALADRRGADAIVLAPIAAPRKGNPALGLDALARARRVAAGALVYALGGVDAETAASCLAAGADGVAAVGAAIGPGDPWPLLAALGIMKRE